MWINAEDPISDEIERNALSVQMRKDNFQFLAMMVNNRPDKMLITALIQGQKEIFGEIYSLDKAQEQDLDGLENIHSFLKETDAYQIEDVETALSVDWTRLFRGVSKGYGPPPPFEALYTTKGPSDIEIMRSIKRQYREMGLDMGNALPSRPDYLGTELEFLFILAKQEADAWEKGENDNALSKLQIAERFRVEHLNPWVLKYCDIAQNEAQTSFYCGLLRMIKTSVKSTFYSNPL